MQFCSCSHLAVLRFCFPVFQFLAWLCCASAFLYFNSQLVCVALRLSPISITSCNIHKTGKIRSDCLDLVWCYAELEYFNFYHSTLFERPTRVRDTSTDKLGQPKCTQHLKMQGLKWVACEFQVVKLAKFSSNFFPYKSVVVPTFYGCFVLLDKICLRKFIFEKPSPKLTSEPSLF